MSVINDGFNFILQIVSSNPLYKSLLIYAVTANPVVLTKTKRNGGNTQAQYALMLLMTDFVEAMNPGLKLKRYVLHKNLRLSI